MERHPRILAKQLLIFSVAVDDSTRRRIHHDARMFDQLEDEPRLAAPGRACHECRESDGAKAKSYFHSGRRRHRGTTPTQT